MSEWIAQFFTSAQQTLTTPPIPTEDAPDYVLSQPTHHQQTSQEDDNITWIPDEPALSVASSRTLTESGHQPNTGKRLRSPRPSSLQISLQDAIRREFEEGRPYERIARNTNHSIVTTHMPQHKPGAGSFRPLDTLHRNPHAKKPSTYGKSPARGGNSLDFATLTGDNVTRQRQEHRFPGDEEHRSPKRRRVEEPIAASREQMSPVTKRRAQGTPLLVRHRSSQSAPSVSRQSSGRGENNFVQSEFRSLEHMMSAKMNRKGSQDSNNVVGRAQIHSAAAHRRPYSAEPEVATGPPRLSHMDVSIEMENSPGRRPRRLQSRAKAKQTDAIDLTDDQEEDEDLMVVSERHRDDGAFHVRRPEAGSECDQHYQESTSPVEEDRDIRRQKTKPKVSKYFDKSDVDHATVDSVNKTKAGSIIEILDESQPDLSGVLAGFRTQKTAGTDSHFRPAYLTSVSDEKPAQESFMEGLSDATAHESDNDRDRDEIVTTVPKALPSSPFAVRPSKADEEPTTTKRSIRPGRTVQAANVVRANGARSNGNGLKSAAAPDSLWEGENDGLGVPESPPKSLPVGPSINKSDIQPANLRNVKGSTTASKADGRTAARNSAASPAWYPSELLTWPHDLVDATKGSLRLAFDSTGQALHIVSGSAKGSIRCKDIFRIEITPDPDERTQVIVRMRPGREEARQYHCISFDDPTEGHNFAESLVRVTSVKPTYREPDYLQRIVQRARTEARPARSAQNHEPIPDPELDLMQQRKALRDATTSPEDTRKPRGLRVTEKLMGRSSSSPPPAKGITSRHFRKNSTEEAVRENGQSVAARQNPRRTTRSAISNHLASSTTHDDCEVPDSMKFSKTIGLGDPWDQAVVFPPTGRNRATVDFKDLSLLDEGEWLNDSLIEFQIRYLFNKYKPRDDQVHSLSTHFYSTLTNNVRGKNIDYARVSKWTLKDDIFSKDLVLVPVNEDLHWYLVLIVNLPKVERQLPEEDEKEAKEPDAVVATSDATLTVTPDASDALSELAVSDMPAEAQQAQQRTRLEDIEMIDAVSQQTEKLHLESTTSSPSILFSSPIKAADTGPTKPEAEPAPDPDANTAAKIFRKGGKRKPPAPTPRKYATDQPMVIVMDPLGSARSRTISNIKEYLVAEAHDKRGISITREAFMGMNLKRGLPQQANFSDCGVYILGYIEKLMQNPAEFARRLCENDLDEGRDWGDLRPSAMRSDMREALQGIAREQAAERVRLRREKKKARKEAMAKSSPVKPPPVSPEVAKKHPVVVIPSQSPGDQVSGKGVAATRDGAEPKFPVEDVLESATQSRSRALQAVVEESPPR